MQITPTQAEENVNLFNGWDCTALDGLHPLEGSSVTELVNDTLSYGEGNGNSLQYSCLESPMARGAWWATVHGVAKSQTQLSDQYTHTLLTKQMVGRLEFSQHWRYRIPCLGKNHRNEKCAYLDFSVLKFFISQKCHLFVLLSFCRVFIFILAAHHAGS